MELRGKKLTEVTRALILGLNSKSVDIKHKALENISEALFPGVLREAALKTKEKRSGDH